MHLLLYSPLVVGCVAFNSQQQSEYGSISVNIQKSNQSLYGSIRAPFVMMRILEYANEHERRSLILCNRAFNDANDLLTDASFQCISDLLSTAALKEKLNEISVFRRLKWNASQLLQNEAMLKSLRLCQFKFIGGEFSSLNGTRQSFLLFSLSSNIPCLFKRGLHEQSKHFRRVNIILTFNKKGILLPNAQNFSIDDFIYLLEHEKVYKSFGINETKLQEWIHISDQIATQGLFNKIRCSISNGGASILFKSQCLFCCLNQNGDNMLYYDFSIAMSVFLGWSMALCSSFAIAFGIAHDIPEMALLLLIIIGTAGSVITIRLFFALATHHPAFNGVVSGMCISIFWLALLDCLLDL